MPALAHEIETYFELSVAEKIWGLDRVYCPKENEKKRAEERIASANAIAAKVALIDPDTIASAMKAKNSPILHADIRLDFWKQSKIGISVRDTLSEYIFDDSRNLGMGEFCDLLAQSKPFMKLRAEVSKQGLHAGFQPLPVIGNSTTDWSMGNFQPVLTFSRAPLQGRPDVYSNPPNENTEREVRRFNESNIGPVVKIDDLRAPKPAQPHIISRLLHRGGPEVYRIA